MSECMCALMKACTHHLRAHPSHRPARVTADLFDGKLRRRALFRPLAMQNSGATSHLLPLTSGVLRYFCSTSLTSTSSARALYLSSGGMHLSSRYIGDFLPTALFGWHPPFPIHDSSLFPCSTLKRGCADLR
uniref:ORF8 n=1 Tax=Leishmania infantum TaxID=5671 RepID=Q25301_LEIIN|nr:ORF8 [Leishmania infantum]